MIRRSALTLLTVLTATGAAMAQSPDDASAPSPRVIVKRAWDAAGGLDNFDKLGILAVEVSREEVAQAGKQESSTSHTTFVTPGPNPGRIDIPDQKIVAADDGREGWAVVAGKVDGRPSTKLMVKRLLATNLFTLMLPFSLSWEGVGFTGIEPAEVDGVPVWRLSVTVPKTFFHTPQIATNWTIDIDRSTYAVVQAEAPSTDLGKGIVADGMRVTWRQPQRLMGVAFPGEQRIVGLAETGAEKTHTRVDRVRYRLVDSAQRASLFGNPVPPELRPTPPTMQPPPFTKKP